MKTFNRDHSHPSVEENNDSGLTAGQEPLKPKTLFSKGDARYWLEKGRLFKNHGSADYSCRFTALGQREHFRLGTANKKTAAAKAAEIYAFVQANGWVSTFARYKPKNEAEPVASDPTVGDLIDRARLVSSARAQSFDTYAKAFRRIVSEIKAIPDDGKFDERGGGSLAWQNRVNAVALSSLTPADVVAWKNARLRSVESDPLAKKRATVTINSLIRNSKALFGKKILPFVEDQLPLPRPLPFDGVPFEKAPSMRYVSKMDPYTILALAKMELEAADPEAFKVIVLALVCGLRRSEIDKLLWRAFDFVNSVLRVEASEYHELKSEDSAGVIDLESGIAALFRIFRAENPDATFVINTTKQIRTRAKKTGRTTSRSYRCEPVFERVIAWLKGKGIDNIKPLHTLRKEIGSIIASEHGIFEASRYLRHSDIRITSAIYADKKKAVTPKVFAGLINKPATETVRES